MRRMSTIRTFFLVVCLILTVPGVIHAQRNAREVLSDHSCMLQAGDLTLQFIYLHPDSLGLEVARMVLRADEFTRYQQEMARLQNKQSLLALRLTPYRDARFDPT